MFSYSESPLCPSALMHWYREIEGFDEEIEDSVRAKVIRPDRSHLKDIRDDLATHSDPWQSFYAGKFETKKYRVSCSIDRGHRKYR